MPPERHDSLCSSVDHASLVDLVAPLVDAVARRFRIPTCRTEDLSQDVLLKILSKPHWMDDEQPLTPFIRQIARNLCRDHLRQQRHRKYEDILIIAGTLAMPSERTIVRHGEDEQDIVERLLKLVGPADRVLLRLRYLEGLNVNEIATAIESSPSTVRQKLSRAMKTLRTTSNELKKGN
jgi:RNA polymerase sigma-70 factor (ECF subfamily)